MTNFEKANLRVWESMQRYFKRQKTGKIKWSNNMTKLILISMILVGVVGCSSSKYNTKRVSAFQEFPAYRGDLHVVEK